MSQWGASEAWADCSNFVGFVGGRVLVMGRQIGKLPGPRQTATLAGEAGIVSRFYVMAEVLGQAAIATDGDRYRSQLSIARHEATLLADYASKAGTAALIQTAAECAHMLQFVIEDLRDLWARSGRVKVDVPWYVGVAEPPLEVVERPWRHRDNHPTDELTKAFEAAIDARKLVFAYTLFDALPPETSTET